MPESLPPALATNFAQSRRAVRTIVIGLGSLAAVIAFGVIGYVVQGWPVDDALYMVVITISTVGYGEIHPEGVFDQLTAAAEAVNGLIAFGVFTGALTGFVSTKAGAK